MKILKAEFDIPGYKKELVDVKELMLTNETNYMMKRYDKLEISMNRVGMIYPILYTDLDSYWLVEKRWPKYDNGRPIPGIAVHTGNKRVWWAKQNGYDKIEGIYVNSKAEQAKLVKITHIPHGKLPHYPNSYGGRKR